MIFGVAIIWAFQVFYCLTVWGIMLFESHNAGVCLQYMMYCVNIPNCKGEGKDPVPPYLFISPPWCSIGLFKLHMSSSEPQPLPSHPWIPVYPDSRLPTHQSLPVCRSAWVCLCRPTPPLFSSRWHLFGP